MNQANKAITALTQFTDRDITAEENLSTQVYDQNFTNMVSGAFRQFSETDMHYKQVINTLSSTPDLTSDPQALLQLQIYLGEYSNYVSLASTVARKGVSTIETLEKSQ